MQFEILWMLRPDSCCFSIQPGKLPLAFSFYLFIYFHFFFMFVHVMRFYVWVWTQISSLETKMEMILRHQARIIHAHTVHSWISTHTHTRAHTQTHSFPACVTVCVALFMQAASVLLWLAHPTQTTSTSLASGDFSVLLHLQERSSVPWNIWERCYCKVRRRSGLSTEGKSERKVKNKREKWGRETGGEKRADGEKNSIGDQEKVEKERERWR